MQITTTQFFSTFLCTLLSTVVILYGMHTKDVLYLSNAQIYTDSKIHTSDEGAKLSADLHHHIDKQSLKSLQKYAGDSGLQLDTRSLRILKEELQTLETRQFAQLKSWLTHLRAKLAVVLGLL